METSTSSSQYDKLEMARQDTILLISEARSAWASAEIGSKEESAAKARYDWLVSKEQDLMRLQTAILSQPSQASESSLGRFSEPTYVQVPTHKDTCKHAT